MKTFSNFISVIFHPLLMTTYGCLIVFFALKESVFSALTPLKLKLIITSIIFVVTFVLPALNLYLLYKLNYISSIKIENRRERIFPLVITSIFYFGLYYLLIDLNIWPTIKLFVFGAGICILLAGIIHFWWQISAHMIGIGGLTGALIALCYFTQLPILFFISGSIFLGGIIGFSRLYLNAHNQSQIYMGFTLGALVQFLLFFMANNTSLV